MWNGPIACLVKEIAVIVGLKTVRLKNLHLPKFSLHELGCSQPNRWPMSRDDSGFDDARKEACYKYIQVNRKNKRYGKKGIM